MSSGVDFIGQPKVVGVRCGSHLVGGQDFSVGQLDARQLAAEHGAGVDADGVGQVLENVPEGGMAEDHRQAQGVLAREKLLADPQQVLAALVLQRYTGPDTGVDEQEPVLPMRERGSEQEFQMADV